MPYTVSNPEKAIQWNSYAVRIDEMGTRGLKPVVEFTFNTSAEADQAATTLRQLVEHAIRIKSLHV